MKVDKKILYAVVAIPVLVLNVWHFSRRIDRENARKREAAEQLRREEMELKWHTGIATRIKDAGIEKVVRGIAPGDCRLPPPGGATVSPGEIAEPVLDDLHAAIAGLARAYAEGTSEALIAYMRERGESLRGDQVTTMRALLVAEGGYPKASIDALTPAQVFGKLWKEVNAAPHWDALVSDSSCLQLWRSTSGDPAVLDEIGRDDIDLWHRRGSSVHNFAPARRLDQEIKEHGSVVLADVKLIIRHDQKHMGAASPYYFRFWLDSADKRWHPLGLMRIDTFEDAPVAVLF